jgi:hypothetical protein
MNPDFLRPSGRVSPGDASGPGVSAVHPRPVFGKIKGRCQFGCSQRE